MAYGDTFGSAGTIISPAAREAERKERDRLRQALEKSSANDIRELDAYIQHITTFHHDVIPSIDWESIVKKPAPKFPNVDSAQSEALRRHLAASDPALSDWFVGRGPQTRAMMERAAALLKSPDHRRLLVTVQPYYAELYKWEKEQLAWKGVRDGDDTVIMSIVKRNQTLAKHHKLGKELGFSCKTGLVHAVLTLNDISIVPDFQFKQMSSGKLAEVKRPQEKVNRIYRAHAASASLKVASDIFRLVPRPEVVVTCIAEVVDLKSGIKKDWPILSVRYQRDRLLPLDLKQANPISALNFFTAFESFDENRGFRGVAPAVEIPMRLAV